MSRVRFVSSTMMCVRHHVMRGPRDVMASCAVRALASRNAPGHLDEKKFACIVIDVIYTSAHVVLAGGAASGNVRLRRLPAGSCAQLSDCVDRTQARCDQTSVGARTRIATCVHVYQILSCSSQCCTHVRARLLVQAVHLHEACAHCSGHRETDHALACAAAWKPPCPYWYGGCPPAPSPPTQSPAVSPSPPAPTCGNGVVEDGEDCEPSLTPACTSDCKNPRATLCQTSSCLRTICALSTFEVTLLALHLASVKSTPHVRAAA